MKIGRQAAIRGHLGELFEGQTVAALGEGQLLERFVERRDGPAFAALVARHGPMVLAVCRRLLADPLDVEDAFQATFLVLVRRAGAIRDRERLGPWLFGVARRVATRARADLARRRAREAPGVEQFAAAAALDDPVRELGGVLVEEIDRLPAALREPILLCCVEGLSYDEAAAELRSTAHAIRGRLARARGRLKDRLTRRGFAPTAGALLALLASQKASAAVPPGLLQTTYQVARAGAVPAVVDILAQGVIRTMILTKSKILAAALVACGVAGSGVGLVAQDDPARSQPRPASTTDRLDQVEKKLDRLLQALEGQSNRPTTPPVEAPTPARPAVPPVPPTPPRPPAPPSPPDALESIKRALIEGMPKGAGPTDLRLSMEVFSDAEALEKLDPTTRALVEAAMKGADLKDLKGKAEVVQKDGKTMIIVPGGVTVEQRSPMPPTPPAPAPARLYALESKLKRMEGRLDDLERRNGIAPRSGRNPEESLREIADAIRRSQRRSPVRPGADEANRTKGGPEPTGSTPK